MKKVVSSRLCHRGSSFHAAFIILEVWKFNCARCANIFWHCYYSFCIVFTCLRWLWGDNKNFFFRVRPTCFWIGPSLFWLRPSMFRVRPSHFFGSVLPTFRSQSFLFFDSDLFIFTGQSFPLFEAVLLIFRVRPVHFFGSVLPTFRSRSWLLIFQLRPSHFFEVQSQSFSFLE